MLKQLYIISILLFCTVLSWANDGKRIKGQVVDESKQAIIGANIYWEGTQKGTTSDVNGYFEIEQTDGGQNLVVSYIGYATTVTPVTNSSEELHIVLKGEIELEEVVVSERKMGTISSRVSVLQTQKITYDELCRAACCNLAESFETNPSVDVSYADAATGARQIKLLGLSGTYVQMLTENYPNFRGAASLYGLDYVPGPWMESIQVSKGTSSVKNGYEAIAGQINVEFKKPPTADIFSANVFASDAGRYEGNADASWHINENLSTGLLVHYSNDNKQHDGNDDGFLDLPLKEQVNLMNRWYHKSDQYVAQYGVRYLHENRKSGQSTKHHDFADPYKIKFNTNRAEVYTKQAYIIDKEKVESVALILSGSYHEQLSMYDRTPYNIYQNNVYASLMYEKEFTPMHSLSTGLSMNYDGFNENLGQAGDRKIFNRDEVVPGAYVQYTYNLHDKFILLAGLRADYSNQYDFFVTPRIHLKYNPTDWFHVRVSAGKGFRTPNILAENNYLLSSSRKMVIADKLDQEEAWNTGLNLSFYIPLFGKELTINGEWYYTDFRKQVVVDMDSNPHAVRFYNLDGKSYSSSYQVEASYPFFRGFTLTAAYRYTDAKTDYRNEEGITRRLKKPLLNDYKGLLTASYQTPLKKWQFDLTGQFNGGGRMPEPDKTNPLWKPTYGAYTIVNAQITKYFRTWSIYVGAENLFDYTQDHPIIDAGNPRGDNFDASMVWGPIHGRTLYAGIRFNISRD
ncbi:outer membrane receptor for ferrienterochelin and colicins [Parabacteroides sp. PF5-5]|uniref:TonB-dependent receptor n=1 Tax=unclassified Parabacteroides TaxID=2649774 RepID=UPI0024738302|nr:MULTISPECIES: TonB-dependent receptor [unclassified Parabacteroides]MDH6304140.1 outer membrane receptor for ferrienterochelin and colicins [Parabacteroides sp. PH5-39]MDH6315160.1 outer membrane receptor for ferrienterochelin and colicins [Parabacteroides sp. PF5-13]MDH6318805.1 outer membrane receptor for ferrienterochelin and colicins [Parabacteroides sp. PH5-13]MDH6322534.1 outer membrane receptor for ferrienterochelin and colicins [Parabacteroides sp. PH5-8]MDH6326314.1 outer membrane 